MKNDIFKIVIVFIVLSLCITACKNDTNTETKEIKTEESSEIEEIEDVTLTVDQYKTVGIETGKVEMRNLNAVIKANGYTNVPPQNNANVSTLIGGTILNINVLEGTYVTKGKILATIQNLDVIEIQENYATANANIEYLQQEYERQRILSDENINSKKSFQEVKAKLTIEQAHAKSAKARLTLLNIGVDNSTNIPILAPISGYIGKIHTTKGGYAEIGKPLFEIIDNSQMHLDLNVYEKDLSKIKEGQNVDVILINQSNKTIKATIFGINKTFTNESKSVAVHAKINSTNVNGLISGMYVTANINVNNVTVQTLPLDAIVKNGEKYYVFIEMGKEEILQSKNGKHIEKMENDKIAFKPIEVITGITDLGYTEITFLGEVPKDKTFVTKGTFYLLSAMLSSNSQHEH
jgi:membrane fusion protein, heavy metal efflux system